MFYFILNNFYMFVSYICIVNILFDLSTLI
nr:MAG TPA: hypothetical protein [Caudoviricetes sp.]